ncbi:hypothetical protein BH24ACT5_BH24ACT5_09830 [soil metagenome]
MRGRRQSRTGVAKWLHRLAVAQRLAMGATAVAAAAQSFRTNQRRQHAISTTSREVATPDPAAAWVVPTPTGECPPGYPVKVNADSGIYHQPGGRFYDRTRPDRCYASATAAEAGGFRAPKAGAVRNS